MAINLDEAYNKSVTKASRNVLTSKKHNFFIWQNGAQLIGARNFRIQTKEFN